MRLLKLLFLMMLLAQGCAKSDKSETKSVDEDLVAFVSSTISAYFPELGPHPIVKQYAEAIQSDDFQQTESAQYVKDYYYGNQLEEVNGVPRTPLESYLIQEFLVSTNLIALKSGEATSFEIIGGKKEAQ